ncbi:hypothetical protein CEXT_740401 [Caerostris extrusa]|uniref:Uncharacterized protein n=1 Tax=Caerostris extrusa TaxID=172846 RepID=A0AAV4MJ95_CAEEX|nr:hypothetical protein CEXT_740401 [Caerostris extrusa]
MQTSNLRLSEREPHITVTTLLCCDWAIEERHQGSTRCSPFQMGCLQTGKHLDSCLGCLKTISTVTPRDCQISLSELFREITNAFETSGRFRGGTISSRLTQTSLTTSFYPFTQARGHQEWG